MEFKSHSQIGQDAWVWETLGKPASGYFVEVGAYDNEISNSLAFEEMGWNGVLIEPQPEQAAKLRSTRRSTVIDIPVYSDHRNIQFLLDGSGSGIIDTVHADPHVKEHAKTSKVINLHTCTLNDVLQEVKAPKVIDYLSIDTEGSELEVLIGVDLDSYVFRCITIEINGNLEKQAAIRALLESKGYHYSQSKHQDDYYIWVAK